MNKQQLFQANLDNLTSLWQATTPATAITSPDGICSCASWPHRFWFPNNAPLPAAQALAAIIAQLPSRAMVPIWQAENVQGQGLSQALQAQGFAPVLEQTLMVLPANTLSDTGPGDIAPDLAITPATEPDAWAEVCGRAFGYAIDAEVISRLYGRRDTRLLEARWQGTLAGTAILHKTGNIVGIHQVGVAPGFQRRGIARALMLHCLSQGVAWRARFLTLQASAAGLPLYRQLGFVSQGQIRSYRRHN